MYNYFTYRLFSAISDDGNKAKMKSWDLLAIPVLNITAMTMELPTRYLDKLGKLPIQIVAELRSSGRLKHPKRYHGENEPQKEELHRLIEQAPRSKMNHPLWREFVQFLKAKN